MAKLKNPFLSFHAVGTLAKKLTVRNRDGVSIGEKLPFPTDAKTSSQLAWRTMYQLASKLWHTLSATEKATWEALARPRHITGYALFMSNALRPNPGIYLPLLGGTMQGNVDMDSHKISGLPAPAADPDAATKGYVDSHGGGFDPFAQFIDLISWASLDGFYSSGIGLPNITPLGTAISLRTDSSPGYYAYIFASECWPPLAELAKPMTLEFLIYYLVSITDQNLWLRLDTDLNYPPGETDDHLGWKLIGARLWASNANETSQTITDTGIDLAAGYQFTRLKTVYTPGTDIKFYVNDALVATHTTNLPALLAHMPFFYLQTLAANWKLVELGRILIQKVY